MLPITHDILSKIVAILPGIYFNNFEVKLFKTAFTLAYGGLFRVGEITATKGKNPNHIVSDDDVQFFFRQIRD